MAHTASDQFLAHGSAARTSVHLERARRPAACVRTVHRPPEQLDKLRLGAFRPLEPLGAVLFRQGLLRQDRVAPSRQTLARKAG